MIPCGVCPLFAIIWFRAVKKFHTKRRILFIIMASLSLLSHLIMLVTPNSNSPTVLHTFMISISLLFLSGGVAGSLGLIEMSLTMIVPKKLIGTAYGSIGAVDALSMSLMPILNGLVTSEKKELRIDYEDLEYLYIALAGLFVLLTVFMQISKSSIFSLFDKERGVADKLLNSESSGSLKESLISSQLSSEVEE